MALSSRRILVIFSAVMICFLATPASADDYLVNKTGQLTVFWGRHKEEGSLREACDSGMYTMVIMSFLDVYGHGKYSLDLSGHPLGPIGGDIKHCQHMGVLVSLAIGGFGGDYSLPTKQSALDLADYLWNAYLGGANKGMRRPFGDAWLDGVDFFLERATPAEHYDVLAKALATKHDTGSKPLHLTATPHCRFPDSFVNKALATGTFERIHVRFYDDPECGAYWEQQWDKWTAAYPGSRIFLGLLPSEEQGEYWIFPKDLYYGVMPVVQQAPNYGGVMLWDRFYDERGNYSSYVKYWA
ncbi:hypothetical protein PR202_ga12789 [Eleusine coracana subsp. coracana]|uniref:GH18 domain-containing protein n=1 Tax=Eleusine coracana subsp. coracana TaxID=191504 RepID=A0AAV5CCK5_ELECO|nr:hypothetical protein QOZ80_3AG0224410 [Eleusine coracana subsp. coracana]GJM95988.1 hypothetical protein PR202_ga12789 [Eleusine coracana subsp. coracana]